MNEKDLAVKEVPAVEYLGNAKDPRALFNVLPTRLVNAAMTIKQEHLNMTEGELILKVPSTCRKDVMRLREAIWIACHNAGATGRKITDKQCFYGVIASSCFNNHLQHPERVAYMLRPPANYNIALKEALSFSVEQIRNILEQDHMNPKTGMLDPKIADVKRRLFENLSDRVKGMPVQRTENLNLNKELGPNEHFDQELPVSSEDLDKKIAELEKDMNANDERDVSQGKG